MRPHQWIKNGFVFIGLVFAREWSHPPLVRLAVLAFVAMCLVSSSLYIFNDYVDLSMDQKHHTKKNRPLAAGQIPARAALIFSFILLTSGILISLLGSLSIVAFLLLYVLISAGYTLYLKHIVILDIFVISAGFMVRILMGTVGIGIPPSQWLLFCGFMLTIFIGFAKRRSELNALALAKGDHRPVLEHYAAVFLDKMIGISAACAIMSYSLYTISPETIQKHATKNLIYTVPFVIYGIFRYIYLLHNGGGTDTASDLLEDRHLLISCLCWILVVCLILIYHGV